MIQAVNGLIHSNIRQFIVHFVRKMTHQVFVYGTLKRNEPNHYWLTNPENGASKFIANGTTKTKYPLIIATRYNIPFLLYSPGDGSNVQGEVYEVDDKMLSNLDILEDHPKFYVREVDDILIQKGNETTTTKCWVYFLKTFKPELLKKPTMSNYSSAGPHGLVYAERCNRDPSYDYWREVKCSQGDC
ncbi:putative gamma-glutamylcyclotransferase CG2811 isoform X1 [Cydia amplana]|uniref:putative gamma-glutamylcyclotransferase CG2811 isoform X1 n=1 Tax=Cydia amplana TaxID=1869771 RepID=UPI002FE58190